MTEITEEQNARQVTQQKIRHLLAEGNTEGQVIEKLGLFVLLYGHTLVMDALAEEIGAITIESIGA